MRITVSASASDASCGSPSWWLCVVGRLTVGRDAVEEVALPQRVAQGERHGVQHLVAERDAVLPDGLAVGRLADGDHRDERPQRVDHEFAGRRRTARRDHHEPLQRQRVGLALEAGDLVAERVAGVVEVLREGLAFRAGPSDQAREVLRDRHEATAVVAQVEHQFGRSDVAQRVERVVERRARGRDEVAEEQVGDLAAVGLVDVQVRHGGNGHRALGHARIHGAAVGALVPDPDGDPFLRGSEGVAQCAALGQRHDASSLDRGDAIAALHAGLGRRALGEHLQDAEALPVVAVGEAEPDELAVGVERLFGRPRADVAEALVEGTESQGLEQRFG